METDFEKLDPDVREEWRSNPVTQAFERYIMTERARGVVDLVDSIKAVTGTAHERLQHIGGRLAAVDELLQIMRRG